MWEREDMLKYCAPPASSEAVMSFSSTVLSLVRGANRTSLNSFLSSFLFPSVSKAAIAA